MAGSNDWEVVDDVHGASHSRYSASHSRARTILVHHFMQVDILQTMRLELILKATNEFHTERKVVVAHGV